MDGFTIADIEESYHNDSVFTGTFSDAADTELCDIYILMDTDSGEEHTLEIKPYKSNPYASYSETGIGVSTAILIDIIQDLTGDSKPTLVEFLTHAILDYGRDYTVLFDGEEVPQMTILAEKYATENTVKLSEYFEKDKRGLLRKGETYASSLYDSLTQFGRDARLPVIAFVDDIGLNASEDAMGYEHYPERVKVIKTDDEYKEFVASQSCKILTDQKSVRNAQKTNFLRVSPLILFSFARLAQLERASDF